MITMCAICVQKLKIYSYIYTEKNELVALAKNINNVVVNKK